MDRKDRALQSLNLDGIGLEIGPLDHPLVDKKDHEVYYADHMSLQDLKEKYKDEPVDFKKVVEPDYVLGNKTLKQTIRNKEFDYIIASHVIEHIPDTISWFKDIASILKTNGILSLIIPDGRFTFDITREVSKPADIIGAYLDGLTRPSSASMYDYTSEYRDNINSIEVWSKPYFDYSKKPFHYSKDTAYQMAKLNASGKVYVDAHCYVYTPYSFTEILRSLICHDLLDFKVMSFNQTLENDMEFFVSLQKIKPNKQKKLASLPTIKRPRETWEVERDLVESEAELERVINSRSWKITKPLRLVKEMVNKKK